MPHTTCAKNVRQEPVRCSSTLISVNETADVSNHLSASRFMFVDELLIFEIECILERNSKQGCCDMERFDKGDHYFLASGCMAKLIHVRQLQH